MVETMVGNVSRYAFRALVGWTGWALFVLVEIPLARLGVSTWALAGLDTCMLIGVSLWIADAGKD